MTQRSNGEQIHSCNDSEVQMERFVNPSDIYIIRGYGIEVFLNNLNSPISIIFDEKGNIYIADSGMATGNPCILKFSEGEMQIIAEDFIAPISGINYLNGVLYVSHRGYVLSLIHI